MKAVQPLSRTVLDQSNARGARFSHPFPHLGEFPIQRFIVSKISTVVSGRADT